MKLRSSAFADGGSIPLEYSCDGNDVSPPLEWADLPSAAKSLALVVEDPDAPHGPFVHWVLFNVPATAPRLPKGASGGTGLPKGAAEGTNGFGGRGWGGPCPPGGAHRYVFRSWALDHALDLPEGTSASEVKDALAGHVLAEASLQGRYERR